MPDTGNQDAEIDELRERVRELEGRLEERRSYGLVWEEPAGAEDDPYETEQVRDRTERELPLMSEEDDLAIGAGPNPHLLIEGDNYFTLSGLTFTHQGKIDVIYIDPPYNTGRKDFIYNDRFVAEDDAYRHSKWLSFMAPRLTMAEELLTEEGVIIVSIDDNELAHLRLLMDQIFGEHNFIGNIIRATNSTKSNSNFLSINYDYTVVFAKNKARLEERIKARGDKWQVLKNNVDEYKKQVARLIKMKLPRDEITEELKELTKYPRFVDFVNYWYVDERGLYRKGDLGGVKNGNMTPLFNPLTGEDDPVPPGGYRTSSDKLAALVADERIHFHTDGSLPTIKRYLDENPKQRPKGIMSDDQRPDNNLLASMGIDFDNPKQLSFMKRILSIFDSDVTVLDFFAGSATTGHAILDLNAEDGGNRKFILCTDNQNGICRDVAHRRLKCVIEGWSFKKTSGRGKKRKTVKHEIPGIGGTLRFFVSDKDFVKRSGTPDETRRAFRSACRDLIRIKEDAFEPIKKTKLFDVFGGRSSDDRPQYLGILYGLDGRDALIKTLSGYEEDAQIIIYAFSLGGQADPTPFEDAFGARLQLGSIPEQLLKTYERVFSDKLFGGWST